jgi:hypothetical protein
LGYIKINGPTTAYIYLKSSGEVDLRGDILANEQQPGDMGLWELQDFSGENS